jgi:hypothetical protein
MKIQLRFGMMAGDCHPPFIATITAASIKISTVRMEVAVWKLICSTLILPNSAVIAANGAENNAQGNHRINTTPA